MHWRHVTTSIIIGVIILLLVALVIANPALEKEHIIIVGAQAPSSDVITGAEFAARAQAQGTTFTSITDEDALEHYNEADITTRFFVVIDGDDARLLGAHQDKNSFEEALEELGLSVTSTTNPAMEDLLVTEELPKADAEVELEAETNASAEENNTLPPPPPTPQAVECECSGDNYCLDEGEMTQLDNTTYYCDGSQLQERKGRAETCTYDYECRAGRTCTDGLCGGEQNIVERVFSWLATLF